MIKTKNRKFILALAAGISITTTALHAATWYMDSHGSDSNSGSSSSPFATVSKAQSAASSGDTVIINGGTYAVPNILVTTQKSVYAVVNYITKGGITYQAAAGTRPVFDFSAINPTGMRTVAFWVHATNVTFQGFDVIGLQENITTANNQSVGFAVYTGWSNTWNQVNVHDGDCVGFYIGGDVSGYNLFYRCDSYNNTGIDSYSYGNADGFGCHTGAGGLGNVFRECRAWNNSDDGYDCLNCAEVCTFDHCWSYLNGNNGGNGNGFKVGGWGCSGGTMPAVIPVHIVQNCLAALNSSHGFYANHQPGQAANWYNNTAYSNKVANFDMLEGLDNGSNCSIPGTQEVMHNNLAYGGRATNDLNESGTIVANNSWTLAVAVSDADFQGVDPTQMIQPRNADGSLPDIAFMHLASGSDLIDAGINVGLPYNGTAPDLGCFESGSTSTLPSAPTGLSATGGNLTVGLNWTQSTSSGITGNNVYRSTSGSGGPYNLLANLGATTSYSDSTVSAGSTYFYSVTAVNSGGESGLSVYAGATTIPAAPTGLAATAGTAQVALSWTASTGAASYNVKRSTTSGGNYTTIATGVTVASYTDTSAVAGTTYYYVVSAMNGSGESPNSAEVSATPTAPQVPAAPTNLAASSPRKKQINLSWTQSTSGSITSNKIYRATVNGGPYSLVTTIAASTAYSDSGLASGTTYYYVVTAVNSGGESAYSNQGSATSK